ncbi:hypothetical protein NIES592_06010 [Fischerella major NIES-592]|jgi:hypothetical protein|uniref:Uncharacterized protein n=1 Tax=Fischerella major NIES-592 TaxID=210994 RepID=A0A1U7H3D6_9CYAN|nr:hypothetical protein NIES592_06010 [Fischerella major NIES-592]PMB52685.1 hypothetical protein CEN39_08525 [Fischerella thermalis CCMEE 5201]BAU04741.1 hypothetical protein FIS3754_06300 [Fischerella sp. NIES-3754]BCX06987.1 MAG: hypothetical protein KatS3mg066_0846 [Fischerella sp.]
MKAAMLKAEGRRQKDEKFSHFKLHPSQITLYPILWGAAQRARQMLYAGKPVHRTASSTYFITLSLPYIHRVK